MIERSCPKGTGIIGLTNKFNQFDKGYYSQLCTCFRSMEPRPHFRVNLMTLAGYKADTPSTFGNVRVAQSLFQSSIFIGLNKQ